MRAVHGRMRTLQLPVGWPLLWEKQSSYADAHVCDRIRGRRLTDQDEPLQHGGLD
jgi:hypothetical protein